MSYGMQINAGLRATAKEAAIGAPYSVGYPDSGRKAPIRVYTLGRFSVDVDGLPAPNLSVVAFSESELGPLPPEPARTPAVVRDTGGVRVPTDERGEFCLPLPSSKEPERWLVQIRGSRIVPTTTVLEVVPSGLVVVVRAK